MTMDQESWLSCEKTAVLQGGFLLAERLCLPASLGSLQKQDWGRVGQPIVRAVREVCQLEQRGGGGGGGGGDGQEAQLWKQRLLCAVWSKLLSAESGEDAESAWKENALFPLQSALPAVCPAVLFGLVKSLDAAPLYAGLLLALPPARRDPELRRLVGHLGRAPADEGDAGLLLRVWVELWRGGGEEGTDGSLERMFAERCARLPEPSTDPSSPQAAKRFKSDPDVEPPPAPSSSTGVLAILLQGLEEMRDHFLTPELCFSALSTALDSLTTCYLMDAASAPPPARARLRCLTRAVALREGEGLALDRAVREAQRDVRAVLYPSRFGGGGSGGLGLGRALAGVSELLQTWGDGRGPLKADDTSGPRLPVLRLQASLQRTLTALEDLPETSGGAGESEGPALRDFQSRVRGALESLSLPEPEGSPKEEEDEEARVAAATVEQRLEGHEELADLLAAELSWRPGEREWVGCLERNAAVFRRPEAVTKLVSALLAERGGGQAAQRTRLKDVVLDVFSRLPLADKNAALAEMLAFSSRGLHGALPPALTQDFPQELNMAFNCLTKGGAASERGGEDAAAVSAVARVAFQDPEAAVRRCCQLALGQRGGHALLAGILRRLPGLAGGTPRGRSLLLGCLEEAAAAAAAAGGSGPEAEETEERLLRFLVALMEPAAAAAESPAIGQSCLSPQEVVCAFVLPHLSSSSSSSSSSPRPVSLTLALRLLLSTLSLPVQEDSPHWVLGCSPFPLLLVLSQQLHLAARCWEEEPAAVSTETKELLVGALAILAPAVGREVALAPPTWSRALSWLYGKARALDWTVRFHLKPVWGEHFKREVPSALLAVCELPERDWAGLEPEPAQRRCYGQGTGLLAWLECCAVSDPLRDTMLACLDLDQSQPTHVSMFGKGLLVALVQVLPWSSVGEWRRLLGALRRLLLSGRLHAPYGLEYVDFLPLLDLRAVSCPLRLSALLLRALQMLCGASCSDWLPARGWAHVGRLYALAVRELADELRAKAPPPLPPCAAAAAAAPPSPESSAPSLKSSSSAPAEPSPSPGAQQGGGGAQEVLFVLSQLFCHTQHVQVMMAEAAGGASEPLFLAALEILSHYEAVLASHPDSSSALDRDDTLLFFSTITDNLQELDMKSVLQQKISQVLSC